MSFSCQDRKKYFTSTQVALLLETKLNQVIRRLERGILPPPTRLTLKGQRLFDDAWLEKARRIRDEAWEIPGGRGPLPKIRELPEWSLWKGSPTLLGLVLGISRQRAYQILHHDRETAQNALRYARQKGRLPRSLPCKICGQPGEKHVLNYNKPLEFVWHSHKCHMKLHGAQHPWRHIILERTCRKCQAVFSIEQGSQRKLCKNCWYILRTEIGTRALAGHQYRGGRPRGAKDKVQRIRGPNKRRRIASHGSHKADPGPAQERLLFCPRRGTGTVRNGVRR